MDGEREANKCSAPVPIANGSADMTYHKLLDRRSSSLDLETAFKRIRLSHELKPELCQDCKQEKCQCPAFTPETPCSSASSTPTKPDTDDEDIPELVDNVPLQVLYPSIQSPSDEEADREVVKSVEPQYIIG